MNKFKTLLFALLFALIFTIPVLADTIIPAKTTSDPLKTWVITFSTDIDNSTINTDNIKVVNSAGEEKEILPILALDKKTVNVFVLDKGYKNGDYTLTVNKNIKSIKGKNIKDDIKMNFTVSDEKYFPLLSTVPQLQKYKYLDCIVEGNAVYYYYDYDKFPLTELINLWLKDGWKANGYTSNVYGSISFFYIKDNKIIVNYKQDNKLVITGIKH